MAVRKQEFDDYEDQAVPATKRSRITIDITPELRRRIKIAAAQSDLSIGEYLGRMLEQAVPEESYIAQQPRRPVTRKTLDDILQLREEINQHTNGYVFSDSTEIIRQMRDERTRELEQL